MERKFLKLLEAIQSKYPEGKLDVGSCVVFKPDYKSTESYKKLPPKTQNDIEKLISSGLHIRVINTDSTKGVIGTHANLIEVGLDNGGARVNDFTSIPADLVTAIDYSPNLPPVPDAMVRPNNNILKPEPVKPSENSEEMVNQTQKTQQGDKLKPSEIDLKNTNVKIPAVTPKEAKSPEVGSYTAKYL